MRLRYQASNSTSKILTEPSPFQQDLVAVSLDLLLHILAKASWSRILTEPSPFQQDLVAVSLDLQLPNLSLKPEMVKMILMLMMLEEKWTMLLTVPASQLYLSTVKFLQLFLNCYSGNRATGVLRWFSNCLLDWSYLSSKLHQIVHEPCTFLNLP